MPPPIEPSPKPNAERIDELEGPEPGTDPEMKMPVTQKQMRREFRINEWWTFFVAVATAGAALLGGYAIFISKAEAAGKKAAAEVAARQDRVEERQKNVELDVRDLYKAIMYRQRSERLERAPAEPAKDGGP